MSTDSCIYCVEDDTILKKKGIWCQNWLIWWPMAFLSTRLRRRGRCETISGIFTGSWKKRAVSSCNILLIIEGAIWSLSSPSARHDSFMEDLICELWPDWSMCTNSYTRTLRTQVLSITYAVFLKIEQECTT